MFGCSLSTQSSFCRGHRRQNHGDAITFIEGEVDVERRWPFVVINLAKNMAGPWLVDGKEVAP